MHEINCEIHSRERFWELFDNNISSVFIHRFSPNHIIEWWKTDFKAPTNQKIKNLSVRLMEMDIQTDLDGLRQIFDLNTKELNVYQFDKPIANSLTLESLPKKQHLEILKQNGLKHFVLIGYEFARVGSVDENYIKSLEDNPEIHTWRPNNE